MRRSLITKNINNLFIFLNCFVLNMSPSHTVILVFFFFFFSSCRINNYLFELFSFSVFVLCCTFVSAINKWWSRIMRTVVVVVVRVLADKLNCNLIIIFSFFLPFHSYTSYIHIIITVITILTNILRTNYWKTQTLESVAR